MLNLLSRGGGSRAYMPEVRTPALRNPYLSPEILLRRAVTRRITNDVSFLSGLLARMSRSGGQRWPADLMDLPGKLEQLPWGFRFARQARIRQEGALPAVGVDYTTGLDRIEHECV